MKKILIIITTAFVPYGGLTTVMMNYYRAMDKSDLKIDFASTNIPDRVLLDELALNRSDYYFLGNRKKDLSQYLKELTRILKEKYYDVVHVNGNSATMLFELLLAKKYGIQTRIAHGHNTQTAYPLAHGFFKRILRRQYTHAIAVSNDAGKWLYGNNSYIILNNAIDLKKYKFDQNKRDHFRKQFNLKNKLVLGNVGKLNEQKNHKFLLKVFYELKLLRPEVCLILVGGGPLEKELKQECKNLGIERDVIFTGMRTDVNDFLQIMDIYIFPSLWEGLPLALVEAQASGLPCVVSDSITRMAKCTDYVIYKPLTAGAFSWAREIIDLCEKKIIREDSIFALRRHGFDIEIEAEKLKRIYTLDVI